MVRHPKFNEFGENTVYEPVGPYKAKKPLSKKQKLAVKLMGMGGHTLDYANAEVGPQKAINQAINISVGDIDLKQISKYAIYMAIIVMIAIGAIIMVRGFIITFEQMGCATMHVCLNPLGCDAAYNGACDPFSQYSIIYSRYWAWDLQWMLLCVLYVCLAIVVGIMLYVYSMWLFNKLLRIDMEIAKLEHWIFGQEFEGEVENQIQTKL